MLYGRQRTGLAIPFITERNFVVDRKKFAFYMCCGTFAFKYMSQGICFLGLCTYEDSEILGRFSRVLSRVFGRAAKKGHLFSGSWDSAWKLGASENLWRFRKQGVVNTFEGAG